MEKKNEGLKKPEEEILRFEGEEVRWSELISRKWDEDVTLKYPGAVAPDSVAVN